MLWSQPKLTRGLHSSHTHTVGSPAPWRHQGHPEVLETPPVDELLCRQFFFSPPPQSYQTTCLLRTPNNRAVLYRHHPSWPGQVKWWLPHPHSYLSCLYLPLHEAPQSQNVTWLTPLCKRGHLYPARIVQEVNFSIAARWTWPSRGGIIIRTRGVKIYHWGKSFINEYE